MEKIDIFRKLRHVLISFWIYSGLKRNKKFVLQVEINIVDTKTAKVMRIEYIAWTFLAIQG